MTGISTSKMMAQGLTLGIISTASAPFFAMPTTSMSVEDSMTLFSIRRMVLESSQISTLAFLIIPSPR